MKGWLRYAKWALTGFVTVCAILVFYDTFYQSGALGAFLHKAADVLAPVLYGMAMAYLLAPVVNWFERLILPGVNKLRARSRKEPIEGYRGWLRALSILLSWSSVLLVIYLLLRVLVPELVESVRALIANAEGYYNTVYGWGNALMEDNPRLAQWLQQQLENYRESAGSFIDGVMPKLENVLFLVTGGMSWAYMNRILTRWHEAGLLTAQQVEKGDQKPAVPKGASGVLGAAELANIQRLLQEEG